MGVIDPNQLKLFTGTEQWYRHPIKRDMLYTDGVQYVAERGQAYWLLDELVFAQVHPVVTSQLFQVWNLKVNKDQTAELSCEDGNYNPVFKKKIPFTDFPQEKFTLWL